MDEVTLPGIATAHSHVFQRLLRGMAQEASERGSFWSWRAQMYRVANTLTPETLYDVARYAYLELANNGVTAVGEFHYLHHQPDGQPYADRTAMSDAVIAAAQSVGLRISLLRVVYQRAGYDKELEAGQRRFCDAELDHAFEDVVALKKRYADDDTVCVGLAPHSVRAVGAASLRRCAEFAKREVLPLHMHLSEQPREIEECVNEHKQRPIELVADLGMLSARFVAVHATHVSEREVKLLAEADAVACICRSTERDLGDGAPPLQKFVEEKVRLCTGVDGYVQSDPFLEARAMEFDERTRTQTRHILSASDLKEALSKNAYDAIGFDGLHTSDEVQIDSEDLALGTLKDSQLIWSVQGSAVKRVAINGCSLSEDSYIRVKYRRVLEKLS